MRTRIIGALALAVVTLLATNAGVLASHRFSDVPSDSPFHDEIDAVANSGVTAGCTEDRFCPGDPVTRRQMAAFLTRLGALRASDEPVVNATAVDGRDSSDLAWTAGVPIQVMQRIEHVDVTNPEDDAVQCVPDVSDFEDGADTPVFTVTFQLADVPTGGGAGWGTPLVNVQVRNVDVGRFDLCFATIDGRQLPDGRYTLFRQEMVPIGVS